MNEEIGVMERQDTLDIGNDLETIEAVADDGGRDYNLTLRQVCHYFNSSELRAHNLTEACTNPAHIPQAFMIFVQVFYALVCILGLCGNTLVIYVVLRYISIYLKENAKKKLFSIPRPLLLQIFKNADCHIHLHPDVGSSR